uniref:Uncharacterized protein n=1 Tax=Cacopsylla melanoneura TaxID=428564 RepID=A0A8D8QKE5_9HEMI
MYINHTGIFRIDRQSWNNTYESEEELKIGNFNLKIYLQEYSPYVDEQACFYIHLSCNSDEVADWECYTKVSVSWSPKNSYFNRASLHSLPCTITFTPNNKRTYLGSFMLDLSDFYLYDDDYFFYNAENIIKLDLRVDTFQIKKLEETRS